MQQDFAPAAASKRDSHALAASPASGALGDARTARQPLLAAAQREGASKADPLDEAANRIDHAFHEMLAKATNGVSPMALGKAFADWAVHLALSPGKQIQLMGKAARKSARFGAIAANAFMSPRHPESIDPLPQDKRFLAEEWRNWPYHLLSQGFLLQQQWWHNAATGVGGVTKQHENVVDFTIRQMLDMLSPSNFLLTNPIVLRRACETGGANLVHGFANLVDDWTRLHGYGAPRERAFEPGRNVAVTPGKVVFANHLIELIQYAPRTEKVRVEPILFVPAWIMKYYILDLSPGNSLVRYLVEQGFTVFMISWRNPGEADRDLGMEDYRRLGIMAALDQISAIFPGRKIHAAGYCLGGTLLSIAAATMARDSDDRLKSISLFAAQHDFTEAGELTLFINESQVSFLEEFMRSQGYLDGAQMAGAFQLLRSNDLIWSKLVHEYLMGEREAPSDLMAWNADATRLPYRMHSDYLRHLFLDNDLAEGRFETEGRPVALTDIRAPIFAVGTESDHVSPWRSAFKIHLLADADVTFLLTSGGHNAGIISEPNHKARHYRIRTKTEHDIYLDPDRWLTEADLQDGSWWPRWAAWLAAASSGDQKAPRFEDQASLCPAPGTYALQR